MTNLQVFDGNLGQVRTVLKGEDVWFVAKDVCEVLEIKNTTQAVQKLDEDEVTMFNIGGLSGNTNIINESGLYSLIMTSRKPQAKAFKKWVTSDVIPTIRKTGAYFQIDREEEAINNYFSSFSEDIKKAMVLKVVDEDEKGLHSIQDGSSIR